MLSGGMFSFLSRRQVASPDAAGPAAKKVAVIGPTGKVGRLAVKRLVDQGYTPRILLRHK